ncbi:HesB/YadR/YfhF family protein [Pueribacillus sp. YX66]|uniref:HesB/YadR/YfhF family protein n=1 Tax=Pueribacillus sp. YX66 TaxID=3229242 RepID=UPI00358D1A6C
MNLTITKEAADWYKQEMNLNKGDYIRFFVKLYGGGSSIHPNFSLGVAKEEPVNIAVSDKKGGVTFYFDEQDEWFLYGHELTIHLVNGEIEFLFDKS